MKVHTHWSAVEVSLPCMLVEMAQSILRLFAKSTVLVKKEREEKRNYVHDRLSKLSRGELNHILRLAYM